MKMTKKIETIENIFDTYGFWKNKPMLMLKEEMEEVIQKYKEIENMIKKLKHSVDNNLVDMRNVKRQVDEIYDKIQEKENES